MQITVSGRHVELTDPIEAYCVKRCTHLDKFLDHIQSITFVLDKVHVEFEIEAVVDVEHHSNFVARSKHDDLYAAIDAAVDKLERQLHDWKERISDHKG